jgi:hypothetical protein
MILRERRLRGVARNCRVLRSIRYFSATFSTCPFLESRIAENLSPPRKTGRIEPRQAGSPCEKQGPSEGFSTTGRNASVRRSTQDTTLVELQDMESFVITLTIEQLAEVLKKSPRTIRSDMVRSPNSIPPWFKCAGAKKPLWLQSTVTRFLEEQARRDGALPGYLNDGAETSSLKLSRRSKGR